VDKYQYSSGVPVKYYSKSAGCRRERKCIMRSKKLAVRFGFLTVLLVSLSLASTSYASTRPATPDCNCYRTWRGAVIVFISCRTSGATIYYTRATDTTDPDDAPNPNFSSPIYRYPLYLTRDTVVKAAAFKNGLWSRYINTLVVDFWPFAR
jgi:hypothetical protein